MNESRVTQSVAVSCAAVCAYKSISIHKSGKQSKLCLFRLELQALEGRICESSYPVLSDKQV